MNAAASLFEQYRMFGTVVPAVFLEGEYKPLKGDWQTVVTSVEAEHLLRSATLNNRVALTDLALVIEIPKFRYAKFIALRGSADLQRPHTPGRTGPTIPTISILDRFRRGGLTTRTFLYAKPSPPIIGQPAPEGYDMLEAGDLVEIPRFQSGNFGDHKTSQWETTFALKFSMQNWGWQSVLPYMDPSAL